MANTTHEKADTNWKCVMELFSVFAEALDIVQDLICLKT